MKKLTKEQMEIVKSEHPEFFTKIEVGKWYWLKGSRMLFCFNGNFGNNTQYGFNKNGVYQGVNELGIHPLDEVIEATPEEVKSALIAEAKRRYKVGDRIKSLRNDWVQTIGEMVVEVWSPIKERDYWSVTVVAEEDEWNKMCSNPTVFKDGQWASVLTPEKPSLQDDIQALKDRWPDINFTVIAEEKK